MESDVHYGVIPGTKKPALLKPGPRCSAASSGSSPTSSRPWCTATASRPHIRVEMRCELHLGDLRGPVVAVGYGAANSWERKHRHRRGERTCPACGLVGQVIRARPRYGGGWLCWKSKGGCGAKWPEGAPEIEQQQVGDVENVDPYDLENTFLKMAKKRPTSTRPSPARHPRTSSPRTWTSTPRPGTVATSGPPGRPIRSSPASPRASARRLLRWRVASLARSSRGRRPVPCRRARSAATRARSCPRSTSPQPSASRPRRLRRAVGLEVSTALAVIERAPRPRWPRTRWLPRRARAGQARRLRRGDRGLDDARHRGAYHVKGRGRDAGRADGRGARA